MSESDIYHLSFSEVMDENPSRIFPDDRVLDPHRLLDISFFLLLLPPLPLPRLLQIDSDRQRKGGKGRKYQHKEQQHFAKKCKSDYLSQSIPTKEPY